MINQPNKSARFSDNMVLLIISAGITLGLLPFVVLRVMQADWPIAFMNSVVVMGTAFLFFHLLITKNAAIARVGLAIMALLAMTSTIYFKGAANVLWVYPALTTTFFLLSPRIAAALTLVFLLIVKLMIWHEVTFVFLLTFGISSTATFLFSYAFSARMHKQAVFLRRLVTTDSLTGIGNRRGLEEKLLEITRRIKRHPQQSCSLIIFDIDFFKRVNDTYGHGCGDEVLKRFVEVISKNIRDVDSFYRLGGEEFVLVLESTHLFEAKKLAQKLAKEIENTQWHLPNLAVTTSAGIAQYNTHESTYDWMNRADEALYRAKSGGRNQCHCCEAFSSVGAYEL
jgi:diguanylate cyclase (GGDEF)-like protein